MVFFTNAFGMLFKTGGNNYIIAHLRNPLPVVILFYLACAVQTLPSHGVARVFNRNKTENIRRNNQTQTMSKA